PAALLVADGREDGALAFQPAPDLAAQLRAPAPGVLGNPLSARSRGGAGRGRRRAFRRCGSATGWTIPAGRNGWRR
ncbi:hypothetical protein, partial [Paracoccus thiocyanatus]|uniref:hypothetical protein n=1 Tax=Paracoccus thiocyanatus TaxID=34006 RepID=UPI001C6ED635